jgi:hypothetical protein
MATEARFLPKVPTQNRLPDFKLLPNAPLLYEITKINSTHNPYKLYPF